MQGQSLGEEGKLSGFGGSLLSCLWKSVFENRALNLWKGQTGFVSKDGNFLVPYSI